MWTWKQVSVSLQHEILKWHRKEIKAEKSREACRIFQTCWPTTCFSGRHLKQYFCSPLQNLFITKEETSNWGSSSFAIRYIHKEREDTALGKKRTRAHEDYHCRCSASWDICLSSSFQIGCGSNLVTKAWHVDLCCPHSHKTPLQSIGISGVYLNISEGKMTASPSAHPGVHGEVLGWLCTAWFAKRSQRSLCCQWTLGIQHIPHSICKDADEHQLGTVPPANSS